MGKFLKMIKIPEASQIKAIDNYTIEHEPISSADLMERAATRCFARIKKFLPHHQKVLVFCGPGNNGGDGLVIARLIAKTGMTVEAWILKENDDQTDDNKLNLKRIQKLPKVKVGIIETIDCLPEIGENSLVVDALFGTGLNRPLEGLSAAIVEHINRSKAKVISIDVPSGLFLVADYQDTDLHIIRAHTTLALQFPKLPFFFSEFEDFIGNWELLDIHLHQEAIQNADVAFFMTELCDVKQYRRPRSKFSHKGHFGHALLVAGSEGKGGAAILAAEATLRSGAGLITVQTPREVLPVVQSSIPEAMARGDENARIITHPGDVSGFQAIAFGPGVGTDTKTGNALKLLIQNSKVPLVIDADGLNLLAQNPTWMAFLPQGSILTPHPREFERLVGKSPNAIHRLEAAREFAFKFGIYILLKGAYTAVVAPNKQVFFNPTGNPGMATAGSGDVLTGIILGWLAQGYPPLQAAIIGVFLHGLAGDMAAARLGLEGMIAGDLNLYLPKASRKVFQN